MAHNVSPDTRIEVVTALATGKNVTDAATAGGVSRRTVHRWLEDPAFRIEVMRRRGEILDRITGALIDAGADAVTTLRGLLAAENENVQVRAALGILSALVSVRESTDLEARIRDLEEADLLSGDTA